MMASTLGACASMPADDDASMPSDAPPDAPEEGTWSRCCPGAHVGIPGGQSRGSGDSLECYCPARTACNYGWGACFMDAGLDSGAIDDAGFADAASMDDASIDALTDAAAMP